MKKMKCNGPGCSEIAFHHENPTPRGDQFVTVPDDYDGPVFCSFECMLYWEGAGLGKICERCNAICELVKADEPWHPDHWQCPKCDSTYCL